MATHVPYVAAANYTRLRDQTENLLKAIERAEHSRELIHDAAERGELDGDLESYVKSDLERVEQEIADAIAQLACDYTNIMDNAFGNRLAQGFLGQHTTLHANVLRAVLAAAQKRKGDGRMPTWAQNSEDLGVPFV